MRKTKRSPREIAIGIGALALCGMCGMIFNKGDKGKDASSTATATATAVAPADSPAATDPPTDAPETAPAATEPPTTEPATVEPPTVEPPTVAAAEPTQAPAVEQPPAPPVAAFAGSMKAEAGTCPDSHPIKGNINEREDTRIYHMPGSQSYRQTKPEECFATEADAQAAGYKPRQ